MLSTDLYTSNPDGTILPYDIFSSPPWLSLYGVFQYPQMKPQVRLRWSFLENDDLDLCESGFQEMNLFECKGRMCRESNTDYVC